MALFNQLVCVLLAVCCLYRYSDAASITETDVTTPSVPELQNSLLVVELLKRVKLLEERAGLSATIDLNQQKQFESLNDLIEKQKIELSHIEDEQDNGNETDTKTGNDCQQPQKSETIVAFTAYLSRDISAPAVGRIVVFDKVILNEGQAYNELTGVFQATRNGVYNFFFSTYIGTRHVYLGLLVNGDTVVCIKISSTSTSGSQQSSNRPLVRLQEGDTVRVVFQSGTYIYGLTAPQMTTFSGYLIA